MTVMHLSQLSKGLRSWLKLVVELLLGSKFRYGVKQTPCVLQLPYLTEARFAIFAKRERYESA